MAEMEPVRGGRFSGLQVAGIVAAVMLGTALLTIWVVRTYIYPSEFEPVRLSAKEQRVLDTKLERLESFGSTPRARPAPNRAKAELEPEPHVETDASREISLTEREINALIASNTDLAPRAAIDLSKNLASAKLLIPMDPDFPMFGGRTLRVNAGVELAFANDRPVVALRGISIMGVPIPNAWLGNLKNVDLVEQFGTDEGFWKTFAAGVEQIEVEEGRLKIKLRE
jgi:plasmid maintenance system antidote protein VapI